VTKSHAAEMCALFSEWLEEEGRVRFAAWLELRAEVPATLPLDTSAHHRPSAAPPARPRTGGLRVYSPDGA
jgi:hypothetical protein